MTDGTAVDAGRPVLAVDGPLRSRPPAARVGMATVFTAAVVTCVALGLAEQASAWTATSLWLFGGLAAAGAVAVLDVVPWWQPPSARRPDGSLPSAGTFVDIADLFFVAAALLLGPLLATIVSLPSFVVDQMHNPTRAYKQLYNIAAYALGGGATWATFHALLDATGTPGNAVGRPGWLVSAILAALVFEVVNLAACTFARWTMHGLTTQLRELLRLYPVWTETSACLLAVMLAALWLAGHWLVVLSIFPILILRQGLYLRDLQVASRTDPKTGLFNVTHFTELAEREIRRALRQGSTVSVLVADLDHLRTVNTNHGHLAGDAVITGVANILRDRVREFDIVCRFGGEEFIVLLPDAGLDDALATAERLRVAVAEEAFHAATASKTLHTTMSLGVAGLRTHGATLQELLHAADLAVYRAKADGRNLVRLAVAARDNVTA